MSTRPLPANWLRTDALVTVGLMGVGALLAALTALAGANFFRTPIWMQSLGAVIMVVPLVVRRRFPLCSGLAVNALYILLANTMGTDINSGQVTLFLAFFSMSAWSGRRQASFWSRVAVVVSMAIWLFVAGLQAFDRLRTRELLTTPSMLTAGLAVQWITNAAFFAAAWFFGDQAWRRVMEQAELIRANDSIEALQAELVSKAIGEERVRIARELHDVVAHHVTTMSVQAAAARRLMDADPKRAKDALKQVESGARLAVKDLRTMVLTLRTGDGEREGLPTLDDLAVLVTSSRLAGRDVNYEVIGEVPPVTPAVELTLYRVTQEALTNASKHAGPNAKVAVRLRGRTNSVELEVADDGIGMRPRMPGTGTGLIGMRERVAAVGGTFEAGSKPRGGFRVRAEIPVGVEA